MFASIACVWGQDAGDSTSGCKCVGSAIIQRLVLVSCMFELGSSPQSGWVGWIVGIVGMRVSLGMKLHTSPSMFFSFKSSAYLWERGADALEDVMRVAGAVLECAVVVM